jgi:hypothetical protein
MAGTLEDAYARMELKTQEFNEALTRIQTEWGRRAPGFVLSTARKLIKKLAFNAPIKTGRLRAGFWPAALATGMTTSIYTSWPNDNEGSGVAKLTGSDPMVLIENTVPYVGNAGGRGTAWWHQSYNEIISRLESELAKEVEGAWNAGG